MGWLRIAVVAVVLALLATACGGGNDAARPGGANGAATAAGSGNGGSGSRDGEEEEEPPELGIPAPAGQVIIEVDGQTFNGEISECLFDNGGFSIASIPGELDITFGISPIGEDRWIGGVAIFQAGEMVYTANDTLMAAIEGPSIAFTMNYGHLGRGDVGEGLLRATCPTIAAPANPGGPAEANTLQIGDRLWTRSTSSLASDCYLQVQPGGAEIAGFHDALDGEDNKLLWVRVTESGSEVYMAGPGYDFGWVSGTIKDPASDLMVELDFETMTIRGNGTFTNENDGATAQGSFEFLCEG